MFVEASLFLAVLGFYWRSTGLYKLSYLNIRALLASTCALNDILAPCVAGHVPDLDQVTTRLSLFVYIPHIFSIATLSVAVAVATSVIGNLRDLTAQDWHKRFDHGVQSLQICFMVAARYWLRASSPPRCSSSSRRAWRPPVPPQRWLSVSMRGH